MPKMSSTMFECLLGFCLTTFSAPPQILAIDSFLLPNSRNENDAVVSFPFYVATAAGLF